MKLLDPIANVKTIGLLIIILGVLNLLGIIPRLLDSETYEQPIVFVINLLSAILFVVVGLGLRKVKLWGLYALIGLVILDVLLVGYTFMQGETQPSILLIVTIVLIALSVWFYTARNKFSK